MTKLNEEINALIDAVKDGAYADRSARMAAIDELLARYERPTDPAQLDRLADLCLREELTDQRRNKADEEYPVFSERQLARRSSKDGKETVAATTGTDGRNHRVPTRRQRKGYEHSYVNMRTRAQNRERRRIYRDFTRPQPTRNRMVAPAAIERYLNAKYTKWQRKYS